MATYIYGCSEKDHPRKEVTHGMKENPVIRCDICDLQMHRIPQPFRHSITAGTVLKEWTRENFDRYRARRKGVPVPPFSKHKVNRPNGAKQKDYNFR